MLRCVGRQPVFVWQPTFARSSYARVAMVLNTRRAGAPPIAPEPLSQRLVDAARNVAGDPATLELLAAQLNDVDLAQLVDDGARTAFWLNVYNTLSRHAIHAERASGNLLLRLRMFDRAQYGVAGNIYSLNVIEHGLLRRNSRPPASLFRTLRASDPRLQWAIDRIDPRVHFALNCGARSCPPVRSYDRAHLDGQLETATRSYFETECQLDRTNARLTLPRLCKYYASDFGTKRELVRFAALHGADADRAYLESNIDVIAVQFGSYDWTIASPP